MNIRNRFADTRAQSDARSAESVSGAHSAQIAYSAESTYRAHITKSDILWFFFVFFLMLSVVFLLLIRKFSAQYEQYKVRADAIVVREELDYHYICEEHRCFSGLPECPAETCCRNKRMCHAVSMHRYNVSVNFTAGSTFTHVVECEDVDCVESVFRKFGREFRVFTFDDSYGFSISCESYAHVFVVLFAVCFTIAGLLGGHFVHKTCWRKGFLYDICKRFFEL